MDLSTDDVNFDQLKLGLPGFSTVTLPFFPYNIPSKWATNYSPHSCWELGYKTPPLWGRSQRMWAHVLTVIEINEGFGEMLCAISFFSSSFTINFSIPGSSLQYLLLRCSNGNFLFFCFHIFKLEFF